MPKSFLLRQTMYIFVILCLLVGVPSTPAQSLGTDPFPKVITPDPVVQMIIDEVDLDQLEYYDRQMVGEFPVWVDDDWYSIPTRYTYSGTPIQKATHWVGQHMEALGLDVTYQVWDDDTNPNVIGEIPGLINPQDIYIIGGHIDAAEDTPGADDDGSGSSATLIAADILSQFQWGCTLRFAFWTGEEQWMLGSSAYADMAYARGDNILAYLNLDMLAWNTPGSEPEFDLWYEPSVPGSQEMAEVFGDVVPAYGLDLVPHLVQDFDRGGDHESFWNNGYASIMVIEDYDGDFNPYYHGGGNGAYDIPDNMDFEYFTNYTKAALATFLHLNGCIIPTGIGTLDGHVTDASSGDPISAAQLELVDGDGHDFSGVTDGTGYYTEALPAGIYTGTVVSYGFNPLSIGGIEVFTDTNTTVDFALQPKPVYTVSGYVREAGTNAPLDATVEILDAPVDPVNTDPTTGYFSVEVAEGTWTMRASAENHLATVESVEVIEDTQHDFSLTPICFVIDDDVEQGPGEWFVQSPWAQTTGSYHSPTHSWTDSPSGNYGNNINTSLTSPIMDLTGYEGLKLNFWHRYDTESGYDYARVEYSTNGGSSWTEANSYDGNSGGWVEEEIDLTSLDGQANARLRFRLTSDVSLTGDGWYLDDIQVYGGGDACVPLSAPIAEFTSNSPVMFGEVVEFTNLTSGNPLASYEWDFGDGTAISTEENPTHEYAEVGTYTVVLTATNTLGSDTVSHDVSVTESPDIEVEPITMTVYLDPAEVLTTTIRIGNTGLSSLVIDSVTWDAAGWFSWIDFPDLPYSIEAGENYTAVLQFDSMNIDPGMYTLDLFIASNDPDEPTVTVHLVLFVRYQAFLPLMMKDSVPVD